MQVKKFILNSIAFVFFLGLAHDAEAQFSVSGQVKDKTTKEKMAYCTASVYNLNDSLITGGITNDKGFFDIPLKAGSYKLVFSYLGYFNDTLKIKQGRESNFVGVVSLTQNAKQLDEVQIKSSTSEFNIDKDVQLVTAQLREGSTTTADVLGRMKGLSYDRYNNTVKVDGEENIIILVNGLEKNQDYIKNLPPERIKEVEIIRNPSGRYALDGYTAVINIVLKNDYRGTDFYADNMLIADIDSKEESYIPINNTSLTFNYTHEKLNFYMKGNNFYTNLFIKNENTQRNNNLNRIESLAPNSENNLLVDNMYNNFTIGADYYLNPKHTLSFESNISAFPQSKERINIKQDVKTFVNDSLVDNYMYESDNESLSGSYTGTLFHIYKIDDKSQLKTDFTYSTYEDEYLNSIKQGNGYERYEDGINTKDYSQFYTEYNRSLDDKSSIMAGYGNTWRQVENSYYTRTGFLAGAEMLQDTSDFSLTETRNKLYAYYSRKLTKKLSVKMGGAVETSHPKTDGWEKTYFIAKPHLDFFIKAHELFSVKFKYRTYVDYPRISQVNPFTRYIDPYTIETGNQRLKPEVTHRVSAKMKLLQGLLSVEPYYSFSNNYIARAINPLDDSIFVYSYNNIGDYEHKGIKGDITIPLFKQSFIIQSGFNYFESSISYNDKVYTVNDVRLNSQMIYIHKKTEAIAGIILQKNMVKNIHAQGYSYDDNDYWLFIMQKPFFKKKMTAMLGYMIPTDFMVSYDQGSLVDSDLYQSRVSSDISVLKNLFLFKLTYRFSKGNSVRKLKKDVESENEKNSGGFL